MCHYSTYHRGQVALHREDALQDLAYGRPSVVAGAVKPWGPPAGPRVFLSTFFSVFFFLFFSSFFFFSRQMSLSAQGEEYGTNTHCVLRWSGARCKEGCEFRSEDI